MSDDALERPMEATVAPAADDRFATQLRGFGPIGILAMLVVLAASSLAGPLKAVPVLLWARWSRTPSRELGFVRPRSWVATVVVGVLFGSALKLVLKAVVLPLLGGAPINRAYQYLVGNSAALPGILFVVLVGAALGEEILFRGYAFERLGKLFGRSAGAKTAIVLITSVLFGLAHYPDQGLTGAMQGTIVGLVFGSIFAITGQIWLLMIAHASFDVTAVAIIYSNLESKVAHLIFR